MPRFTTRIFSPILAPFGVAASPLTSAIRATRDSLFTAPQIFIDSLRDDQWPAALQPVSPISPPRAEPLSFPINWGQNIQYTPRGDSEYSAAQLRELARYPIARVCIDNNKDILTRMPHRVQLRPKIGETSKERAKRGQGDTTLLKLNRFFERPNPEQNWSEFLRPIIEDMLVIDAATIFLGRDKSGKITQLRWIEGGGVTRLVDEHGWTPPPPNPAYQLLWEGYPRLDATTDQVLYAPRNIVYRGTPSSALYGMSPTESVAKEIEIGWERLRFVYDFYASGTVPGLILFVPKGTEPGKIKEAQDFLDSNFAGDLAKRRGLQILQGFQESGKPEQLHEPKEPALADIFDEVHTRKICFAYGTSPQRLMRQMNRASAQVVQEAAEEEGTLPWLDWVKGTFDKIIQDKMGYEDYEFAFDPFVETDVKKLAEADKIDIEIGLYTRNEKRQERGDDPIDEPEADQLSVITSSGLIPLGMAAHLAQVAIRSKGSGGVGGGSANLRTTAQGKVVRSELEKLFSESKNGRGHCSDHTYFMNGCPACGGAELLARLEDLVEEAQ
jgi:Phage portal protein